ncbi:MAG: hypothetical protein IT480_15825 [Gammaproteobacteria bacterium]|nr:hypothetical protein [Gammaproteobacteria bacterium]
MRALPACRRALLLLACSLPLVLQVAGAHLHLCFDGQSPRVQMHVGDTHTDPVAANPAVQHVDRVLSLAADAPGRSPPAQPDPPPLYRGLPGDAAPGTVHDALAILAQDAPRLPARHDLLPPLRGPPLTTRA